jgi:D-glycero-alpha-D-manno-heptose-7-phosphate kinase
MPDSIRSVLEKAPVRTSAPCRIDLGGTLDLEAFCLPLAHLKPSTFNIAIDLRTRVCLRPNRDDRVRVSSRGFDEAEYDLDRAPFDHPMGLMFAIAVYFGARGVWIDIDSASPPRSALGGSSAAAVALIAAFSEARARIGRKELERQEIVALAHALEQGAAGMLCGRQDQLAAAFGGVNQWVWQPGGTGVPYRREIVVPPTSHGRLAEQIMVAYCGVPHESRDVNGTWVKQFLSGCCRGRWVETIACTRDFVRALGADDLRAACAAMNRETQIRRELTPEVLDAVGAVLVESARESGCGARFTGAGGGGCVWALGESEALDRLKPLWLSALSTQENARLLAFNIDDEGVRTCRQSP